jgi:HSP20 family molecular chaperone IbpA
MFIRLDPWREFDRLTEEFLRGTRFGPGMRMDAYRKGDEFVAHFDLPGIEPGSIDLTVEKNVLTVKAERRNELDKDVEGPRIRATSRHLRTPGLPRRGARRRQPQGALRRRCADGCDPGRRVGQAAED